jgi:hypothetical protein
MICHPQLTKLNFFIIHPIPGTSASSMFLQYARHDSALEQG